RVTYGPGPAVDEELIVLLQAGQRVGLDDQRRGTDNDLGAGHHEFIDDLEMPPRAHGTEDDRHAARVADHLRDLARLEHGSALLRLTLAVAFDAFGPASLIRALLGGGLLAAPYRRGCVLRLGPRLVRPVCRAAGDEVFCLLHRRDHVDLAGKRI